MNNELNKPILTHPIVICVGPIRSGTTWIYELLKHHPQCITTDPKETSFFCFNFDRGIDWYLSKFQKSTISTKLCADLSPSYFIHQDDLLRVKNFSDEIKIVICLRNPYERLRSIHNKMNASGKIRGVLDYMNNEELRNLDALGYNIVYPKAIFFTEHFGVDNVYYFYFDDLMQSPEKVAKELLDFLGLDHFISASVDHVINPTYEPRSKLLLYIARKIASFLRKLKLQNVVDFVKFTVGKKLLYGSNPAKPNLDEKEVEKLLDHFKDEFNGDIERLEELTGRNLSHWKRI